MRDIIADLQRWRDAGKTPAALATIIETRGSSLRPAGTRMAITAESEVVGSASGGCVDGEVIAEMEAVLADGMSLRRPEFGVSDEEAWSAGLSCGGAIKLLVEPWAPVYDTLVGELAARRPVGFASRVDKPAHLLHTADGENFGSLGGPDLDGAVLMDIAAAWPGPHHEIHTYPQGDVFVEVFPAPLTLLIFGATDIAAPLARMAHLLDFDVIISDARRAFLHPERFPEAEVRFGWPREALQVEELGPGWAVVVLFHDPKFDIPALTLALRSPAFYIGLLGSRTTQADRRENLQAVGFKASDLTRIHGPSGLDIGGKTPGMIALSILSEVIAVRHRRKGSMLSRSER